MDYSVDQLLLALICSLIFIMIGVLLLPLILIGIGKFYKGRIVISAGEESAYGSCWAQQSSAISSSRKRIDEHAMHSHVGAAATVLRHRGSESEDSTTAPPDLASARTVGSESSSSLLAHISGSGSSPPLRSLRRTSDGWAHPGSQTYAFWNDPSRENPALERRARSSSTNEWRYDVFLSFRGVDTRTNFTDHLYVALVNAGINTFRDEDELRLGQEISSGLLTAIQQSRIFIPVFSRNYAFSEWCLIELTQMIECRKKMGQSVFPIFYGVEPSDVRHQLGTYEEAFCKHQNRFDKKTVEEWKEALRVAASLTGLVVNNRHEAKLIKLVVTSVLSELKKVPLVAKDFLGRIQRPVEITRAINCSFLENVPLQKKLMCDIQQMYVEFSGVDDGVDMIKERCDHDEVLIIVDDVDDSNQPKANKLEYWFGIEVLS